MNTNPEHFTYENVRKSCQTATLEFDLTDPDAKHSFHRAVKADNAYSALWDFSQVLRNIRKHGDDSKTIKIEELEQRFYEILTDCEINLDTAWS